MASGHSSRHGLDVGGRDLPQSIQDTVAGTCDGLHADAPLLGDLSDRCHRARATEPLGDRRVVAVGRDQGQEQPDVAALEVPLLKGPGEEAVEFLTRVSLLGACLKGGLPCERLNRSLYRSSFG